MADAITVQSSKSQSDWRRGWPQDARGDERWLEGERQAKRRLYLREIHCKGRGRETEKNGTGRYGRERTEQRGVSEVGRWNGWPGVDHGEAGAEAMELTVLFSIFAYVSKFP